MAELTPQSPQQRQSFQEEQMAGQTLQSPQQRQTAGAVHQSPQQEQTQGQRVQRPLAEMKLAVLGICKLKSAG